MQPGGVGLCNLLSANSHGFTQAGPPHSPQKKPYPEKRQLSIVLELAAPQDHPQNVYLEFLKLGVSPEPGEPATSG